MAAIAQIVDGLGGGVVCELNAWSGGVGGLLQKGMIAAEGQTAGLRDETVWSPVNGPSGLGRRRITIPFVLIGTSANDLGLKVAKLMQATQSPWWLRIRRHGASLDSWLQCFPTVPQVRTDITGGSQSHMAEGLISAETAPYALGARVDGASVAIGQGPGTGTAWGLDINGVAGDTATPLLLRMNDATAFADAMGAFISVRRRGTPSNLTSATLLRQAEDSANVLASGTNITLSTVSDSEMSGASCVRATFAAAYGAAQSAGSVRFAAASLSGPDVPGTYRVFVRVRRSESDDAYVLKPFLNGTVIVPEDITIPAGGANIRTVDLGLVQWPSGQPATISAPLPNASGATTSQVVLHFWKKTAGAATLDIDYVCWIPADEDAGYLTTDRTLPTPSTMFVVVDGYQHLAMVTSADPIGPHNIIGQSYSTSIPTAEFTGGGPRVGPGENRLFVLAGTSGVDSWPLARTLNVAYSYWPRFTWLR